MSPCLGGIYSWTSCTDDLCLVHASEKEGSGYSPQSQQGQRWADDMDYEQVCVEDVESLGDEEIGDT
jgi:hypothetical protein